MRWIAVVVTVVLGFVVARVRADPGGAGVTIPPPPSACDKCADLCQLVNHYQQKAKAAELFRQYAHKGIGAEAALPAGVTDLRTMESAVQREWDKWMKKRVVPCQPEGAPAKSLPAADTQLETNMWSPTCDVIYNKAPLVGDAIPKFEAEYNCKPASDALQGHEQVHVESCMKTYSEHDVDAARKIIDDPRNVADGEVAAYTREAEIVGNQIRNTVRQKGCGWQPTKAQEHDMNAQPSAKQVTKMLEQGWKAVKALRGKGHK